MALNNTVAPTFNESCGNELHVPSSDHKIQLKVQTTKIKPIMDTSSDHYRSLFKSTAVFSKRKDLAIVFYLTAYSSLSTRSYEIIEKKIEKKNP